MIYLIGGAPRVGKTQLAQAVMRQKPMHATSTDAIRYMLRRTLPGGEVRDALMSTHRSDVLRLTPDEILAGQNNESRALWPFLVQYMKSYDDDGIDLVMEGVAVLPELLIELNFDHRVIIIGNNQPTHQQEVLTQARHNPHDWLSKNADTDIMRYSQFFAFMNDYLRQQATTYNTDYAEITDTSFQADLEQAALLLLHT